MAHYVIVHKCISMDFNVFGLKLTSWKESETDKQWIAVETNHGIFSMCTHSCILTCIHSFTLLILIIATCPTWSEHFPYPNSTFVWDPICLKLFIPLSTGSQDVPNKVFLLLVPIHLNDTITTQWDNHCCMKDINWRWITRIRYQLTARH